MRRIIAVALVAVLAALPAATMTQGQEKAPTDTLAVVKGNTEFALALYDKLRTQDGNLFLSPYSISTALAMTYGGARGETAAEMAKPLVFTLDQDHLHPAFAALLAQLNEGGKEEKWDGARSRLGSSLQPRPDAWNK